MTAINAIPLNETFTHVATYVYQDGSFRKIHHRLAVAADLGRPNDGSIRHLRVDPIQQPLNKRQDEAGYDGLIGDYLYQNNNEAVWDAFNAESQSSNEWAVLGANWMETNNAEVTCWVPGVQITAGSSYRPAGDYNGIVGADHGVFAYGWNDAPYNFNGQAGGWVDNCAASVE